MRRRSTDSNQWDIMQALRAQGVSVTDTHGVGGGFPDVVCGLRHLTVLMEIKLPISEYVKGGRGGKRKREADEYDPQAGLTDAEKKFHAAWQGQPIVIVRSIDEALKAIGLA